MNCFKVLTGVLMVGLAGMMTQLSSADTYYVSNNGNDGNAGTSWDTAKKTIQAGVDVAGSNDIVLVTNGVYHLTNQIVISTAIILQSWNAGNVDRTGTVINGNNFAGKPVTNRCFYLSTNCTLSGFTVANGCAYNAYGGGVYCVNSNAIITNCTISGNSAGVHGGGVAFNGTLNNCAISGNAADYHGGGVLVMTCGLVNNCIITNNVASGGGGGVFLHLGGTLRNCLVAGNTSEGNSGYVGGGIWVQEAGNVENCTVVQNQQVSLGSGIWLDNGGVVVNSIIYDNIGSPDVSAGSGNFSYCCTPLVAGTGNTTNNPSFVQGFRIAVGSPCFNKGTNLAWTFGALDLDGNARIINGVVDMGCYENTNMAPAIATQPQSTTNDPGTPATFGVTATGTAPLYYQWQKNATNIGGATDTNYTMGAVQESDEGGYRCIVTNVAGAATSAVATLMVNNLPGIGLSTTLLSYAATYGGSSPSAQALILTNLGQVAFGYSNAIAYGTQASGWFSLVPATGLLAGSAGQVLTGAVNSASLTAGVYYATNTVAAPAATNGPQRVSLVLTVAKANQAIASFTPTNGSAFATTSTVVLAAQASSGLAVTFAVTNGPGVISSLTNLTFTGVGSVSIVASQAGDADWNPAPNATNTLNVTKASAQVILRDLGQTYDGTPRVVTATTVPSGLSVLLTYDGSSIEPMAAGTYAVVGTINDATYAGLANGTLVVAKANQTITFPAIPDQEVAGVVTLSATASSGLTASYCATGPAVLNGNTLTFTGAGTVGIVASQAGDANWNAAANVAHDVTVHDVSTLAAPQNLAASDGTYTDKVAITWSAVSGAGGYQVWRAGENNIGSAMNLGNAIGCSYDDHSSAVLSATMFYYWVKAFNSMATSDFSTVDSGFCRMNSNPGIISGQPVVGDYDGDRKADPAVYDLASGRLFAWLSSAEYILVAPVTTFQVSPGDLPVVGDFDGDRLADPGVFNGKTGSWHIWLSSAAYCRVGPMLFGWNANDTPVPADYDGDGMTDPAITQASSGKWHVWLSSAGYTKIGPITFRQSHADVPVPGQYDADNLADPAVYHPAEGAWYLWLSSLEYAPIGPITFFTPEDHIAVPADYDGDGLADPAAYVPSNGVWRIWESGNGYALKELPLK